MKLTQSQIQSLEELEGWDEFYNKGTTEHDKLGIQQTAVGKYSCLNCRVEWSPNLLSNGRNPKGWWKCPNGCNK